MSSKANALRLVLHTTYPMLQRTFVVTYVILTLCAFVHHQAQFPRSPLIHPPRGARISLAPKFSAHPMAATSPLRTRHCAAVEPSDLEQIKRVRALFSCAADKDTENEAAAACLPFRSSSRSWLGRRGAGSRQPLLSLHRYCYSFHLRML
ncbi:hypothetical protein B0H13DRAFT_1084747 [Mycena leptocephala]|nr:hypothetical protein B0H13DRAFT_1084747 [Mycena leptocephala]